MYIHVICQLLLVLLYPSCVLGAGGGKEGSVHVHIMMIDMFVCILRSTAVNEDTDSLFFCDIERKC